MAKVFQHVAARRDLIEHFVYLAENAGIDTAERFLANAEVSFNDLARQPMIGVALTLSHSGLAGMRKWRIKDFDNHLIFYQTRPDGVSIVRVLHAARDWWRLLGLVS
jgi:toxin ParE1/3/4